MTAILKTWPAFMERRKALEVFNHQWSRFYFTLGRGRPKREPKQIWHTHRGIILGHHVIEEIVRNDGSLPKLRSLSDEESAWQIRPDNWVAVCLPPFYPLRERIYHEGFRGWRYFDLDAYRDTREAKVRI